MAIFKCKMCGGTLEINNNETVAVCEYCGTKQTLPKLDDERKANLYDRANHFRRNNEFDKAMGIYEQILNDDNTDAESYWSIVLCRYGIEYVEDPKTKKRIPTVNRAQYTSIYADEDYKSAIQYADRYQKEIYEEEAKVIDEIQKGILEISQKEEPFDVFICYKETDANGRRTPDSVLATELYHELTRDGFKVFFSRITLEDKLGEEYEPYIFAALNSAKVMVVLGTKPEHFNAVWVKNEWSRYLALIKNGAKKMLVPAYKDMDPYDLPEEFSHLQAQDMSKLGFMQDLIRGIKKILSSDNSKESTANSVTTEGGSVETTIDRAILLIEDGQNEKAVELLEQAFDIAPKHPMIYVGRLLLETGVKKQEELATLIDSFEDSPNYEKAIRFANPQLKSSLEGYLATIKDNNVKATYDEAVAKMSECETEEDYLALKKVFDSISNYADSKDLAQICLEKSKNANNEILYNKAINYISGGSYNKLYGLTEAAKILDSIKSYKDADEKLLECNRLLEIEKEAIAKKKKKNKIIALITTPIIAAIAIYFIMYFTVTVPKEKYTKAEEYFAESNYSMAYEYYQKAGNYEDSRDKAKECIYQQAVAYRNDENWDLANPLFEQILDYKDSSNLIHYHDYKLTKTKDSTCTKVGYNSYECECGFKRTEDIPALGHTYTSATCTEAGKCIRCGAKGSGALGHTNTTICERCGKNTFKTLTFSGNGKGIVKNLNLPDGRFIVKCTSSGTRNFQVVIQGEDRTDMVANEIGSCNTEDIVVGPINDGYIEIKYTDGPWTITIEAY